MTAEESRELNSGARKNRCCFCSRWDGIEQRRGSKHSGYLRVNPSIEINRVIVVSRFRSWLSDNWCAQGRTAPMRMERWGFPFYNMLLQHKQGYFHSRGRDELSKEENTGKTNETGGVGCSNKTRRKFFFFCVFYFVNQTLHFTCNWEVCAFDVNKWSWHSEQRWQYRHALLLFIEHQRERSTDQSTISSTGIFDANKNFISLSLSEFMYYCQWQYY